MPWDPVLTHMCARARKRDRLRMCASHTQHACLNLTDLHVACNAGECAHLELPCVRLDGILEVKLAIRLCSTKGIVAKLEVLCFFKR